MEDSNCNKHHKESTCEFKWRLTKLHHILICTHNLFASVSSVKIQWQEKIPNEDLWKQMGQEPVAKQILQRKWGWIGHTLGKPASSTTRQALTWNPKGKRKRGRPCNNWRRDTEAELKQQGPDQLFRNDQSSLEQSAMTRGH